MTKDEEYEKDVTREEERERRRRRRRPWLVAQGRDTLADVRDEEDSSDSTCAGKILGKYHRPSVFFVDRASDDEERGEMIQAPKGEGRDKKLRKADEFQRFNT